MADKITPYGKIYVRFLTERGDEVAVGDAAYTYLVDKELFEHIKTYSCCLQELYETPIFPVCTIKNSKGYNYQGHKAIITNYETISSEEENFELFIVKVYWRGEMKNPFLERVSSKDKVGKDGYVVNKLKKYTVTLDKEHTAIDEEWNVVPWMLIGSLNNETEPEPLTYSILDVKTDGYGKTYGTVNSSSLLAPAITSLGECTTRAVQSLDGLKDSIYAISQEDEDFFHKILWPKDKPCIIFKNNDEIMINEKENKTMFENVFKGFEFGVATSVRTSIYGPAFHCGNTFVSYDKATGSYIDVTDLLFDIENMNYRMPIAANAVSVGDYIVHQHKWVRVLECLDAGRLQVEDIQERQVITILPVKNVFGFDFYTKLFCFSENFLSGAATADSPFGNLLPLMLMSKGNGKDNLLPLMMMSGGFGNGTQMNPLMMYALMGNKGGSDNTLLMMMALNGGNGFNFNLPTACNCGCHNKIEGEDE
jgi:hypothetical protein